MSKTTDRDTVANALIEIGLPRHRTQGHIWLVTEIRTSGADTRTPYAGVEKDHYKGIQDITARHAISNALMAHDAGMTSRVPTHITRRQNTKGKIS